MNNARFTAEFRAEAVRRRRAGQTLPAIAKAMNCSLSSVKVFVRDADTEDQLTPALKAPLTLPFLPEYNYARSFETNAAFYEAKIQHIAGDLESNGELKLAGEMFFKAFQVMKLRCHDGDNPVNDDLDKKRARLKEIAANHDRMVKQAKQTYAALPVETTSEHLVDDDQRNRPLHGSVVPQPVAGSERG